MEICFYCRMQPVFTLFALFETNCEVRLIVRMILCRHKITPNNVVIGQYSMRVVIYMRKNPVIWMMLNSDYEHLLRPQITARLKQIRKDREIRQETVRYDLGVNIGRIEGGRHCITLLTLARLCDYYGITLTDFFVGIIIPHDTSLPGRQ